MDNSINQEARQTAIKLTRIDDKRRIAGAMILIYGLIILVLGLSDLNTLGKSVGQNLFIVQLQIKTLLITVSGTFIGLGLASIIKTNKYIQVLQELNDRIRKLEEKSN